MMMNKSKIMVWFSSAIFDGILSVSFIVLKLCGVLNWSWWWVLAPVWIPWALVVTLGLMGVVLAIILITSAVGQVEGEDENGNV